MKDYRKLAGKMVKLCKKLDQEGFYEEADALSETMRRAAESDWTWDITTEEEHQPTMRELEIADAQNRLVELMLVSEEKRTLEQREEMSQIMAFLSGKKYEPDQDNERLRHILDMGVTDEIDELSQGY